MNTLDELRSNEPLTEEAVTASATARVIYRFAVGGQERAYALETTVSGSATEAALGLIAAGYEDAHDWLRRQTPEAPTTVLVKWLLGRRRVNMTATFAEPAAAPTHGSVAAVVEVGGVSHEYAGKVSTVGNPYRATNAALASAKNDLWNWVWDQKKVR